MLQTETKRKLLSTLPEVLWRWWLWHQGKKPHEIFLKMWMVYSGIRLWHILYIYIFLYILSYYNCSETHFLKMGCFLYNKRPFTYGRCKIFPLERFFYCNTRPVLLIVWIVFGRSCEIYKSCVIMAFTSGRMNRVFLVLCLGIVSCYNC